MKKNKLIYIKKTILFIFLVAVIGVINLYRSYHDIQIKEYCVENSKIYSQIKLVIVSDLHNHVFGKSNDELVEKIIIQKPDAVLMVGDMVNNDSPDLEIIKNIIETISEYFPVYYALGNHEISWNHEDTAYLKETISSAGGLVLDEDWCDIVLNGQEIRFGGVYEYAYIENDIDKYDVSSTGARVCQFLKLYQDTEKFKIMLAHRPEAFVCGSGTKEYEIDLIISGHLHGGQVVFPVVGGIYGADQGWFPEYVHGLYKKDDRDILITSGLSTNKKMLPRWNNPPEIVVLELIPECMK